MITFNAKLKKLKKNSFESVIWSYALGVVPSAARCRLKCCIINLLIRDTEKSVKQARICWHTCDSASHLQNPISYIIGVLVINAILGDIYIAKTSSKNTRFHHTIVITLKDFRILDQDCVKNHFPRIIWFIVFIQNIGILTCHENSNKSILLSIDVCKNCWMSSSVDPDKMLHPAASDLGLHCFLRPVCPSS